MGEVALPDVAEELGTRSVMVLGALIAHAKANFSEVHSCLDLLLYYLNESYTLETIGHPAFLDGRVGRIMSDGAPLGLIGELHPEALERWQVGMPAAVFELSLDALVEKGKS